MIASYTILVIYTKICLFIVFICLGKLILNIFIFFISNLRTRDKDGIYIYVALQRRYIHPEIHLYTFYAFFYSCIRTSVFLFFFLLHAILSLSLQRCRFNYPVSSTDGFHFKMILSAPPQKGTARVAEDRAFYIYI